MKAVKYPSTQEVEFTNDLGDRRRFTEAQLADMLFARYL